MSTATSPTPELIRHMLTTARTIAIVGASPKPYRAACYVADYLQHAGYRILPVNPNHAGRTILGEPVAASLRELAAPADLVAIFRRSEHAGAMALTAWALDIEMIWMQVGIRDEAAAAELRAAGAMVVMDRCLMVEHRRLLR